MRRTIALPALALALLLPASACADRSDSTDLEYRVSNLAAKVKRLEDENRTVSDRLEAARLKITNLEQETARLRREIAGRSAAPSPESEAVSAPGPAAPSPAAIADYLKTEEGKKLLEEGIAAAQARRDAERRARGIQVGLSRFAEQAGLTDYQTEELTKIVGNYTRRMRDVWSKLRGSRDLSPEERSRLRQEIMAETQKLRAEMDAEVKNLLTPEQYEAFRRQPLRSRGFRGRGAPRRDR